MVSPLCRPAAAAGEGTAPAGQVSVGCPAGTTHCDTDCTVGTDIPTPKPIITVRNSTNARIRFMNGPANITMTRFHGLRV